MADNESVVVGAPLPTENVATKGLLDGVGEDKVVAVFNPLPQAFRVQYARTGPQPVSMTAERKFAQDKGIDTNKDSTTVGHSVHYLVLGAGETKNLPGDIAQIAVRQLVTYMLMNRNKGKSNYGVADQFQRNEVEKEIVINVVDNMTFMQRQTAEEYTEKQLTDLNPVLPVVESKATKPQEVPDPPPGQGVSF